MRLQRTPNLFSRLDIGLFSYHTEFPSEIPFFENSISEYDCYFVNLPDLKDSFQKEFLVTNCKMKKKYLYFLFFALAAILNLSVESFAQNKTIDSLLIILKKDKEFCPEPCRGDTNKVIHLIMLCNEYRKIGDYDSGLNYGNEALVQTNSLPFGKNRGWAKGNASAYNNIGNIYYNQGNYPEALKNYFVSLQINEALKNKKDIAGSYHNIGIIYYHQNNYQEALKNYFAALNMRKEIDDKQGIANSYNDIGLIYDDPNNYQEALKNYFAALKIYEEVGDKKRTVAAYNNIGRIYNSQDNHSEALKMYFASLKINEDIGDKFGIAFSYNNIGNIYWNQVNYPAVHPREKSSKKLTQIASNNLLKEALKNYFAALKIREEIADKQGIVESFINIGNTQIDLNKLKEAQDNLNKALQLSKGLGSKEWIKESYSRLEELDSIQSNWKAAYQHHKLFILYRDSIDNEETKIKAMQSARNYDFEKKEAITKAEQDKKNAVTAAETKKQKVIIGLVVITLLLLLMLAGFAFRSIRITKKSDY